eukprot:353375-Chlamydomonas_euryale.AAC.3
MDGARAALLQEVAVSRSGACRQVAATPPAPRAHCATPTFGLRGRSGGIVPLPPAPQTQQLSQQAGAPGAASANEELFWQVDNAVSAGGCVRVGAAGAAVTGTEVRFGDGLQVFPRLVAMPASRAPGAVTMLVGLLSTGQLFCWDVTQHGRIGPPDAACVRFLDVSPQLAAHGSMTALCATRDAVLVGCSDGVVLGVPAAWLAARAPPAPAPARPTFELRVSSWGIIPLLSSMLSAKSHAPSVVEVLSVPSAPQLALVVYDNCVLKAFHLLRQAEVLSESLAPPPQAHHTADGGGVGGVAARGDAVASSSRLAAVCASLASDPSADAHTHVLVVTLESLETSHKVRRDTLATCRLDVLGARAKRGPTLENVCGAARCTLHHHLPTSVHVVGVCACRSRSREGERRGRGRAAC